MDEGSLTAQAHERSSTAQNTWDAGKLNLHFGGMPLRPTDIEEKPRVVGNVDSLLLSDRTRMEQEQNLLRIRVPSSSPSLTTQSYRVVITQRLYLQSGRTGFGVRDVFSSVGST